MAQSYSVSLDTIVREHNLTVVNRAVDYDRVQITTWEGSRPGLPLAGFYDYFDRGGIIAVEWSENIPFGLPDERYDVIFSKISENERKIEIVKKNA